VGQERKGEGATCTSNVTCTEDADGPSRCQRVFLCVCVYICATSVSVAFDAVADCVRNDASA
jgi:hypothetical protein